MGWAVCVPVNSVRNLLTPSPQSTLCALSNFHSKVKKQLKETDNVRTYILISVYTHTGNIVLNNTLFLLPQTRLLFHVTCSQSVNYSRCTLNDNLINRQTIYIKCHNCMIGEHTVSTRSLPVPDVNIYFRWHTAMVPLQQQW